MHVIETGLSGLHFSLGSALCALMHHFIMVIRISKVAVGSIES